MRPIFEFDVIERPDGTFEARFTDTSQTAPADVTAETFGDLEVRCIAKRIARSIWAASVPSPREGTA
ncbi:hypothetical protein FHS43_006369 [Streptosporangium becharense]|uniref:Uncharacterized protein n=1 Tax=Streptosporangium becharense TaxID=1816182 RepID=A0A7W9ICC2_9ACTN|nr:hypothetical protein [Streptosporangium becharense]MBB2915054.1 hypothetical protein [Streptosporangium becharense]MBB5818103.1 hypothetical protein [Streptosporangium becharense]